MDVSIALLIWLIVAVIVFFLSRRWQIALWSSFALAVLVAWIVLMLIKPANTVPMGVSTQSGFAGIYWIISVVSPIIIIIYALSKMLTDRPAGTPFF